MQLVQETLMRLTIRVVPGADFTQSRRDELIAYFQGQFPGAQIQLQDISTIAPEPNGKYRFSICRIQD